MTYERKINVFSHGLTTLHFLRDAACQIYNNTKRITETILKLLVIMQIKQSKLQLTTSRVKFLANVLGSDEIDKIARRKVENTVLYENQVC